VKPNSTGPLPRALVIGYGNPLRGDDAAGPALAHRLAGHPLPGVEVLVVHQLTPELAARLAPVERVVFVDAAFRETVGVEAVKPDEDAPGLGHVGTPGRLLALTRLLYSACPRAWLVSIPAACMEYGAGLSPRAQAGLEMAVTEVRRLIEAPPARRN
jgi:hydrogenase maturation protease